MMSVTLVRRTASWENAGTELDVKLVGTAWDFFSSRRGVEYIVTGRHTPRPSHLDTTGSAFINATQRDTTPHTASSRFPRLGRKHQRRNSGPDRGNLSQLPFHEELSLAGIRGQQLRNDLGAGLTWIKIYCGHSCNTLPTVKAPLRYPQGIYPAGLRC